MRKSVAEGLEAFFSISQHSKTPQQSSLLLPFLISLPPSPSPCLFCLPPFFFPPSLHSMPILLPLSLSPVFSPLLFSSPSLILSVQSPLSHPPHPLTSVAHPPISPPLPTLSPLPSSCPPMYTHFPSPSLSSCAPYVPPLPTSLPHSLSSPSPPPPLQTYCRD